jgi:hypothetical protein
MSMSSKPKRIESTEPQVTSMQEAVIREPSAGKAGREERKADSPICWKR